MVDMLQYAIGAMLARNENNPDAEMRAGITAAFMPFPLGLVAASRIAADGAPPASPPAVTGGPGHVTPPVGTLDSGVAIDQADITAVTTAASTVATAVTQGAAALTSIAATFDRSAEQLAAVMPMLQESSKQMATISPAASATQAADTSGLRKKPLGPTSE
jgi:hypothetical protein